jgi:hypothetical protein
MRTGPPATLLFALLLPSYSFHSAALSPRASRIYFKKYIKNKTRVFKKMKNGEHAFEKNEKEIDF